MEKNIHVLYVDSEIIGIKIFTKSLKNECKLFTATSNKKGIQIIRDNIIHVVIASGKKGNNISAVKFLIAIKEFDPKPIRILLAETASVKVLKEAINSANIFKVLPKPIVAINIKQAIEDAYDVYQLRKEGKDIIEKLLKANEKFAAIISDKELMAKLILNTYYNRN